MKTVEFTNALGYTDYPMNSTLIGFRSSEERGRIVSFCLTFFDDENIYITGYIENRTLKCRVYGGEYQPRFSHPIQEIKREKYRLYIDTLVDRINVECKIRRRSCFYGSEVKFE